MSKLAKGTRIVASKNAVSKITHRPLVDKQGYVSHLVQGWKENGKWQRKQFKNLADPESLIAMKQIEMENKGRAQCMVLSPLTKARAT